MTRFESLSRAVSAARFTSSRFHCTCYVVESIGGYRATTLPRTAYVVERFEPIPAMKEFSFVGSLLRVFCTNQAVGVATYWTLFGCVSRAGDQYLPDLFTP